jgi:hypothetical protein
MSYRAAMRLICAFAVSAFFLPPVTPLAVAQSEIELRHVAPDNPFTGSGLPGRWATSHNEVIEFQADGTFAYQSAKGKPNPGTWSVSDGTIYLVLTDQPFKPTLALTVTAFNQERIRSESHGGKGRTEFVRQSAGGLQVSTSSLAPPPRTTPEIQPAGINAAGTPHLNNHGGPVASNTDLHVMYWTSDWDSTSSDPQFARSNIDNWLRTWLPSNYFDKSGQYGVHSGSFQDSNQNFFLFPDPGGSTDSALIHLWATGMIETPGTGVPYPCSDSDVYAVMLPPTTEINNGFNQTCGSFGAYHLFAPVAVPPFVCGLTDLGGLRFSPYTIIPAQCATHDPGPGFYSNFDGLTMLMSHETTEAATDSVDSFIASVPVIGGILNGLLGILNVNPAWYDDNAGNLFTQSEAADICESPRNPEVWLNNSLVAAYWSNSDQACAAGPGVVTNFSLGQTGVPPGTPVRVSFDSRTPDVNGGFSIQVATNTAHSYSYPSIINGAPGQRYVTNLPPATVPVLGPVTVTAPYVAQDFLTVTTNPLAAATGNATLTPSNWYNAGPLTIHADQDVSAGSGTRYDFQSWTGGVSGTTHDLTFNLAAPTTAVANYNLQKLITFDVVGIPPATPWPVTVDGTVHPGPFGDWVNTGSTITYSYQTVVPGLTPGVCYVLTGVAPPSPLTVAAPLTVLGTYATQAVPQAIRNYRLVSTQPADGGLVSVTYTADLVNCGSALEAVTARVESLDPNIVPVSGLRSLTFTPVPANSQVSTASTFTLLVNPALPLDFTKLAWSFRTTPLPPQANPGPNQTVKVGTAVMLDGSGSMNFSGDPLSYSWALVSAPAGSRARIINWLNPMAQFTPDVAGTYMIELMVSNSAGIGSAYVTVVATP